MRFSLLLLLILAAAPLAAAPAAKKDTTARRVLSYAELFAEMQACKDSVYRLENAVVKFDVRKDSAFAKKGLNVSTVFIQPSVMLSNVQMDGAVHVKNVAFEQGFSFNHMEESVDRDKGHGLSFEFCRFKKGLELSNTKCKSVSFYGCGFEKMVVANCTFENMFIDSCTIHPVSSPPTNNALIDNLAERIFDFEYTTVADFYLINSRFLATTQSKTALFMASTCERFTLSGNSFEVDVRFLSLRLPNYSAISDNKFHERVNTSGLLFSSEGARIDWKQFAGTFTQKRNADSICAAEWLYKSIIRAYSHFLNLYKSEGDQKAQNAVYVEMKTLQTKYAAYLYRTAPTLETWFDWRLNELLATFSDYGTNSAKGLVYIFTVIIGFGVLYFLFPSEQDNLSRQRSFAFFHVIIGYFSTNATLANLSDHKRRRALDDLHNFRTTLEISRSDVPRIIALLGAPLYGLNKMFVEFSAWLVNRFDIVPGKWNELPRKRKLWTGAALSVSVMGFLLWGIIMRLVNAFALSINAFVTLGYGEIQARGVARYLAVLEGAIGWFLLSIFSVSLISQLLQ